LDAGHSRRQLVNRVVYFWERKKKIAEQEGEEKLATARALFILLDLEASSVIVFTTKPLETFHEQNHLIIESSVNT